MELNAAHDGDLHEKGLGGGDASGGIATVRAVWQKCFLLKCHSVEGARRGIPSSQARRYAQICASPAANDAH